MAGQPTVLVVDDETDLADVYAAWLGDEFDVRTARGGAEAIELVDETVDVALVDRLMPEVSGNEVLEHIREEGYDCRVVMVTAVTPDSDIVEMPFDEYLVKPVEKDTLRNCVRRQLARSARGADSDVLDALGDSKARHCCVLLTDGRKSAGELAELTGYSKTTVYRRLNALKQAGIIVGEETIDPHGDHYESYRTVIDEVRVDIKNGFSVELLDSEDES